MSSIGHRLRSLAAEHGRHPAVIYDKEELSFADLAADARQVAEALARLGVSKGTRVGLLMPNRPDWLRCVFGAWRLGAIVVPINTLYRTAELEHALRHADVTVLLMLARFLNHSYLDSLTQLCPEVAVPEQPLRSEALPCLRRVVCQGDTVPPGAIAWEDFLASGSREQNPWVRAALDEVDPNDDAAIFFTSGSTAAPKGVVHTHAGMLQAADNVADRLGLTAADRTYGYLPLFFNGGLVAVCLATLSKGGAVLLQDVFDPENALRAMERHHCTTFFGWPHQAEALVQHPTFDAKKLAIRKGPGANTKWATKLFPSDHSAVGTWGMTETGPMAASTSHDDPLPVRTGTHGRPMPGLELRVVDPETNRSLPANEEGEIVVRGTSLMRTYYRQAPRDCLDEEGYFHTGDRGRLDENGNLHFVGRIRDVIKTAGVNVAAAEVEAVLMSHPAVKVAHVVPVPHPTRGENVAGFIVRREPGCTEPELVEYCRTRLASYKVPRHLFFVLERELPVLGSGKVDRRRLRDLAIERTEVSNPSNATH